MPYLEDIISAIADDVRALLKAPAIPLGKATPPSASGVYLPSVGDDVTYVGEAKGSKGLRDRLLSKHIPVMTAMQFSEPISKIFPIACCDVITSGKTCL